MPNKALTREEMASMLAAFIAQERAQAEAVFVRMLQTLGWLDGLSATTNEL